MNLLDILSAKSIVFAFPLIISLVSLSSAQKDKNVTTAERLRSAPVSPRRLLESFLTKEELPPRKYQLLFVDYWGTPLTL
jgi:hypothetical protein